MHAIPAAILLQAGGQAEPQLFNMLFPMIAIFGIFYFLLIRPQQKKQKDQEVKMKNKNGVLRMQKTIFPKLSIPWVFNKIPTNNLSFYGSKNPICHILRN